MIKYAAVATEKNGEKLIVVQRVQITFQTPKGVCGSRIHFGSGNNPKSATCIGKPGHMFHRYRKDKKPDMNVAKAAVLAEHKNARFIGWFDSTQVLNNSADVHLKFDGENYVG